MYAIGEVFNARDEEGFGMAASLVHPGGGPGDPQEFKKILWTDQ